MEQQPPPKRGPGRPSQHGEVKRSYFQTRIRESLKQRLEADAAEQGRSLSEEIELRLEESYSLIENRFGGKQGVNLALMLFSTFNFAGGLEASVQGHPEWTMDQWMKHPRCFEEALHTLIVNVWNHRPPPVTDQDFYEFCQALFNWRRRLTQYEPRETEREAALLERDLLRSHLAEYEAIARAADERIAREADEPTAPAEDEKPTDEAA